MRIRQAVFDDFEAIRALWVEFETHLGSLERPKIIDPADFDVMRSLAFADQPVCHFLVAETCSGELAGYLTYFVGVHTDDLARSVHVDDLFVRAELRGSGLGQALMEEVRTLAKTIGATRLFWTVWQKNKAAQDFYSKLGAKPFEEEILMTWKVD
jgi:GNAT superfamily N-acetyltransferase